MSEAKQTVAADRRDFLKLVSVSAPAAAAAAAVGSKADAEVLESESGRMQDTLHTRAYYESARF